MKLTHFDLLTLGHLLGYCLTEGGLCEGFSVKWAMAVLSQDTHSLYTRLKLISNYKNNFYQLIKIIQEIKNKVQKGESLNEQEKQLIDILPFYEVIELGLSPNKHSEFFNKTSINQTEFKTIYPLVRSGFLEKEEMTILLDNEYLFDREHLKTYLTDLEKLLSKVKSPLPILLDNLATKHSICFKYNPDKKCWEYVDTNDFARYPQEEEYYRELDTTTLADAIFDSFSDSKSDYILFTANILSINPSFEIQKELNDFAAQYPITAQALLYDHSQTGLLHLACKNGHLNTVIELLDAGAEIDKMGVMGITPLRLACANRHPTIVKTLLERGANPNQSLDNITLLYTACSNGCLDIVRELFNHGVDINPNDDSALLFMVCKKGYVEIFRELMSHGADICLKKDNEFLLKIACEKGHLDLVKELLFKQGVNIKNSFYYLKAACSSGSVEILQILLAQVAKIDEESRFELLEFACQKGHLAIVKVFLDQGANLNQLNKDQENLLYVACRFGHLPLAKELLARGMYINQTTPEGETPLYIACQNGHTDIVAFLLKSDGLGDIDTLGIDEHTALQVACLSPHTQGKEELFRLLLEKGASLTHKNKDGQTALDIAIEQENRAANNEIFKIISAKQFPLDNQLMSNDSLLFLVSQTGQADIINMLVMNGGNPNKETINGLSPLFLACQNRHFSVVQELLKFNVNVNKATKDGITPLHQSCLGGCNDITMELLKAENLSCINAIDKYGHTPLMLACMSIETKNNPALFKALLAKGASMTGKNKDGMTALDLAFAVSNQAAIGELLSAAALQAILLENILSPYFFEKAVAWIKENEKTTISLGKNSLAFFPATKTNEETPLPSETSDKTNVP